MSDVIINDATVIEGLEACFFDDDFVQSDVMRGKESTGEMEASMLQPDMIPTIRGLNEVNFEHSNI